MGDISIISAILNMKYSFLLLFFQQKLSESVSLRFCRLRKVYELRLQKDKLKYFFLKNIIN